jgi:pre-mRNA splicing factor component
LQINSKYIRNVINELESDKSMRTEAERMIQEELQIMINHDNFKYPLKGMKEVKKPAGYLDINPLFMD